MVVQPEVENLLLVIIAIAGFAAGFINALAGGGSFLTLPALIAAGIPPVDSNASSTVGLFPAQVAMAFASRKSLAEVSRDERINVKVLGLISLGGGLVGGLLLLVTSQAAFSKIVPWLLLFATASFAAGMVPGIARGRAWLGRRGVYFVQWLVSIYGGYFGGGIGILMLATLGLYGLTDIFLMNGLKILLAMLMNAAAVVTFAVTGLVHWPETIVVALASSLGGLLGVRVSRRIRPTYVRMFVIFIGLALSIYFYVKPA
ncbi:MAG: sulfite exporter TauE/SafE family protein [Beijerinckiaceae bacterium]